MKDAKNTWINWKSQQMNNLGWNPSPVRRMEINVPLFMNSRFLKKGNCNQRKTGTVQSETLSKERAQQALQLYYS